MQQALMTPDSALSAEEISFMAEASPGFCAAWVLAATAAFLAR